MRIYASTVWRDRGATSLSVAPIQVWNTFRQTADFQAGKPWLLRFFDQIRFYPVSAEELLQYREDFIHGRVQLDIQEEVFSLKQYNEFLNTIAPEAAAFKAQQQEAFEAERERWAASSLLVVDVADEAPPDEAALDLPSNSQVVAAHVPANVWQIVVEEGAEVAVGDHLVVLESMKMEIAITAPFAGRVIKVLCTQGQMVAVGQSPLCNSILALSN